MDVWSRECTVCPTERKIGETQHVASFVATQTCCRKMVQREIRTIAEHCSTAGPGCTLAPRRQRGKRKGTRDYLTATVHSFPKHAEDETNTSQVETKSRVFGHSRRLGDKLALSAGRERTIGRECRCPNCVRTATELEAGVPNPAARVARNHGELDFGVNGCVPS